MLEPTGHIPVVAALAAGDGEVRLPRRLPASARWTVGTICCRRDASVGSSCIGRRCSLRASLAAVAPRSRPLLPDSDDAPAMCFEDCGRLPVSLEVSARLRAPVLNVPHERRAFGAAVTDPAIDEDSDAATGGGDVRSNLAAADGADVVVPQPEASSMRMRRQRHLRARVGAAVCLHAPRDSGITRHGIRLRCHVTRMTHT